MIVVSVTPRRLVARSQARLEIRFSNTGDGPCRSLVFTLGTPAGSGIRLVDGMNRIDIAAIGPGADVVRTVDIEAARTGQHTLTSPNFSYRDEDDRPVRDRNWRAVVTVAEPEQRPAPAPALIPVPRLRVEHEDARLVVKEWAELAVLVRNPSGVTISDVSVTIDGPVQSDRTRGRIAALAGGKAARIRFNVMPADGGLVPLTVRLAYSYPDGSGALRPEAQEERLQVPVDTRESRPVQAERAGARQRDRRRTVLFLAASPQDLSPLRQDLEFKRIQRERQLSPNRDDFVLVMEEAALLDDIHRALIEHRPDVVHFSGHGDADGGIYVEDESGYSKATNVEGIAEFFGLYKSTVRCLLVNACYSGRLAKAVSRDVDYAIGMNAEVGDNTSIRFSVTFYRSLFGGESVPVAFDAARRLVQSDQTTAAQYRIPELFRRGQSD